MKNLFFLCFAVCLSVLCDDVTYSSQESLAKKYSHTPIYKLSTNELGLAFEYLINTKSASKKVEYSPELSTKIDCYEKYLKDFSNSSFLDSYKVDSFQSSGSLITANGGLVCKMLISRLFDFTVSLYTSPEYGFNMNYTFDKKFAHVARNSNKFAYKGYLNKDQTIALIKIYFI